MLLNQPRAMALMEKHGLDALIATNPNHVTYASNYGGHTPRIYEEKEVFALLPRDVPWAAPPEGGYRQRGKCHRSTR